jgi:hypothetical protein
VNAGLGQLLGSGRVGAGMQTCSTNEHGHACTLQTVGLGLCGAAGTLCHPHSCRGHGCVGIVENTIGGAPCKRL